MNNVRKKLIGEIIWINLIHLIIFFSHTFFYNELLSTILFLYIYHHLRRFRVLTLPPLYTMNNVMRKISCRQWKLQHPLTLVAIVEITPYIDNQWKNTPLGIGGQCRWEIHSPMYREHLATSAENLRFHWTSENFCHRRKYESKMIILNLNLNSDLLQLKNPIL